MSNFIKRVKNYDTIVEIHDTEVPFESYPVEEKHKYGEILMSGVEKLSDFLTNICLEEGHKIGPGDFLLDVGSGYGKFLLHLSLINDFGKLFGVEEITERYEFSKSLKSKYSEIDNVIFVNDDIKNIDVTRVNWIFMNDILFDKKDTDYVFENAKRGTRIISFTPINKNPDNTVFLDCDWVPLPVEFKYYKI